MPRCNIPSLALRACMGQGHIPSLALRACIERGTPPNTSPRRKPGDREPSRKPRARSERPAFGAWAAPNRRDANSCYPSARSISARTSASFSISIRPMSAARARSATTSACRHLPSAQAAAPRNTGSSSASAAASASNDGACGRLPRAIAADRSRPRRLARRSGEPLNRCRNASVSSPRSAASDGVGRPSLG